MPSVFKTLLTPSGEPQVSQPEVNGWGISWNPDDERFYVTDPVAEQTRTVQKHHRNARYWARTHQTTGAQQ